MCAKYVGIHSHVYACIGFTSLFRYRSYVTQGSPKLDTHPVQATKFQGRIHFTKGLMCLAESHLSVKVYVCQRETVSRCSSEPACLCVQLENV